MAFLLVPTVTPWAETQVIFNKSLNNSFILSFDSWTTGYRIINIHFEYQVDFGSAVRVNSPNILIAAHQTKDRAATLNEAIIIAVFDNLSVRKYFVETDGIRYPRDSVKIGYNINKVRGQYRDFKLLYEE